MTPSYRAFVYPPLDGSEWGVTFPDVRGCVSVGASLEDAVKQARDALSGHLAALRADGDAVPSPRAWTEISGDAAAMREAAGAFVHYVEPRFLTGERVRVNIMIDKGLLRITDEAADAKGLTRSGFIEAALSAATEG